MLIIGTFEHSLELEQVLAVLEHNGIARKHILVIPMDTEPTPPVRFITKARDLYAKGFEVGVSCATGSAVIGTSIGFILPWGPIFAGLMAAATGFTIAFGIYLLINKGTHRHLPKKLPEITIIVQCLEEQSIPVMETMWEYRILTVGRVPEPS
ncbi:hypothetical protein [Sporomusa malonica]|uniref:Uncharacterized protein n=1 Tax=Sporomusa malonica TaxID=112901 RepID=A0A1W2BQB5_9FIRM|nr:hypothetical protein [Sporomusa malonica]SMC75016.1 hypothetical protein SAMN04488500_10863 [Sporomusa malonica]